MQVCFKFFFTSASDKRIKESKELKELKEFKEFSNYIGKFLLKISN